MSPLSPGELKSLTSLLDNTLPMAESLVKQTLPKEVVPEVESVIADVLEFAMPFLPLLFLL